MHQAKADKLQEICQRYAITVGDTQASRWFELLAPLEQLRSNLDLMGELHDLCGEKFKLFTRYDQGQEVTAFYYPPPDDQMYRFKISEPMHKEFVHLVTTRRGKTWGRRGKRTYRFNLEHGLQLLDCLTNPVEGVYVLSSANMELLNACLKVYIAGYSDWPHAELQKKSYQYLEGKEVLVKLIERLLTSFDEHIDGHGEEPFDLTGY